MMRKLFVPGFLLGIAAALLIGCKGLHAATPDPGEGRSSAASLRTCCMSMPSMWRDAWPIRW